MILYSWDANEWFETALEAAQDYGKAGETFIYRATAEKVPLIELVEKKSEGIYECDLKPRYRLFDIDDVDIRVFIGSDGLLDFEYLED